MKGKANPSHRRGSTPRPEKQPKHLTRWEIAANLEEKALREEQHLTMTEAARRCRMTRPAISQHEHQERGMTLRTVVKIARGYGMKGPDFFLNQARRWITQMALWLLLEPGWEMMMI